MSTNEGNNTSKAAYSSITSPNEDNQKKRSMAEGIISDLANQRNEIDAIKQMIQVLSTQQTKLAEMVNQQTTVLNQLAQGTTAANPELPKQALNMDALTAIGDVAEKFMTAYKSFKSDSNPPALIDQETINREMQAAFFHNLNTGKSINNFVKDALKKKATKEILTDTMQHLGQDDHSPQ